MKEQVFISYRRDGGDVTAKLICESLRNHGYTVFYDFDSLSGGYFDNRIIEAIEGCNDFILVLPKNSLDRCVNDDDWVRLEIECAMKNQKNIIPVMLPDFTFPSNLPQSIKDLPRVNAVSFVMAYFEGVIASIIDRMFSKPDRSFSPVAHTLTPSEGLEFVFDDDLNGYAVKAGQCKDQEIVVPRTYQGKAVNSVAEDGFRDCSALCRITLPDSIIRIDEGAFNGCVLLDEIVIPDRVTHIGAWAFYNCTSLTDIIIPKNVRHIGKRAFARCTSVKRFSVDTQNLFFCNLGNHLYSKDHKTLINFASGADVTSYSVPDGVTKIGELAFGQCATLVSICLPESVEQICDFAFIDCTALADVSLPARLKHMGEYVFKSCSTLVDITIPHGVTDIGEECFRHCASLKTATLPDTVTSIGKSAFYECVALKNITIPEKVTSIGDWGFYKCTSLNNIVIPKNVSSIGKRAFTDCSSLVKIIVDPQNPFYCNVGNHLFTKDQKSLVAYAICCGETSYVVPDGVVRVEDSAFSECKSLKSITLPESVDYIGKFAFVDCASLTDISMPKRAVTIESFAFKRCVSLTSITVPNGIKYIEEDAFRGCSLLKKVVIPATVTSIGKSAFYECAALDSIDIPPKVTDFGPWAFYGCTKLSKIKIPKSLTNLGNRALADCTSLMSISVSVFNRNYCALGKHLYTKDKKKLVQYAIGSKEKSYVIPDGVTTIGDSAFSKCETLETATIPKSVTCFEDYACDKCTKLKQMIFGGTMEMWEKISLGKSALRKVGAKTVKCADGSVTL